MPCGLLAAFCAYRRKKYDGGEPLSFAAFSIPRTARKEERAIAIYHLSIKIISRGKGKSAVAAAAYRAGEKNKNAQLSREIELALPVELSAGQNISLLREYCNRHFVSAGMCVDVCVHDKGDGNPHAHVMLTMRPIEPDGSWGAKSKKEYILDDNGERIVLKSGAFKTRKVDAVDWNDQTRAEERTPLLNNKIL